jgi:transposase InsO family protein
MTLIDEFTRECLPIRVARRINSFGVIETMADVMLVRGIPAHIRFDNDLEMTAKIVRQWLAQVGANAIISLSRWYKKSIRPLPARGNGR